MKKQKEKKFQDVTSEVFVQDKGIWGRFFKMLWKSKLPLIWIAVYIVVDIVLVNVGVSVTDLTAKMFAGELDFVTIILPFIIFTIVNLIIAGIGTIVSYAVKARIDRNLRRMVWDKITKLPMTYFDRNKPKELLTRITSDTSVISTLIVQVIIPFFTGFYNLIVVFEKVGSYDQRLKWSLLLVIPFVLATGLIMGKLHFGINDTVNRKYAELGRDVSEKVTNELLIKSTNAQEKETNNGVQRFADYYKVSIQSSWISCLSSPVYVIVGMLQFTLIVLIGRNFYQNGLITLAEWIAYLEFSQQVANTLQAYAGYWASFKGSQGSTRRVTYIMDEMDEKIGPDRLAYDMEGQFEFHNVSFSYGANKVLDDINLVIPAGKATAFVGMSGGGKTTLLNLMERFYEPESGYITVGTEDISSYNVKSYRQQIAYITQESIMLSGSIKDNILFGVHRPVEEEELNQVCKAANAYDFIMEFPQGYDTQVGEGGGKLSGGQKQRIAIARALLQDPKFMFLDEATAAMDAKAKQEVWAALEQLMMNNRTTVMVAHDYQTASHADFVVVVDHGHIQDSGTQEELYARNAFFKDFVDTQRHKEE